MSRTYIVAIVALVPLFAPRPVAADPSDRRGGADLVEPSAEPSPDEEHAHEHDYSRFSDGPRRVPTPRGASLARAQRLGLGTRESARQLLRGTPPAAWTRAAAWREGDVERLLWPVDDGRYVRGYGYVRTTRPDLIHKGVDISAAPGTVVRAAADGIVAYSDNGIRGYGNCVLLVHPNGWVTLYAHNARTTVQPGWRVRRGERIALVGNTGISRGPHLHFELHQGGRAIDPLALFDGGPTYVDRVAERAFRAGRVPEPAEPSAEDRPTPPPLAPFAASARASEPAPALAIGSRALLRRLHRFAPTEAEREAAGGRTFRNLLWPLRGGAVVRSSTRGLTARAEGGAAVRAAADGLVAYVGRVGRRGQTVVLVHRMGWVSTYATLDEVHVEAGQRVERGEWIGAADHLQLEVRVEGRRVDPRELLVQIPE